MQSLHGDAIIQWAADAVPSAPSAIVVYEQTNPHDRFGKMMVENLMQRGCPLLSIWDYPSFDAARKRYLERGFDRCFIADMKEIHTKWIDQSDVDRINRLELLDEFEEWNLIQAHYYVLVAVRTPGGASDSRAAAAGSAAGDGEGATADGATDSVGDAWVYGLIENPFAPAHSTA